VEDVDVAIIGAGIAGLIAARALADQGRRVCVLEARMRIGGRIHTDAAAGPVPIERGAELIHGGRVRIRHYLDRYGLKVQPDGGSRGVRLAAGGRLRHPLWMATRRSMWRLGSATSALSKTPGIDVSAAEFLRARKIDGVGRQLAEVMANGACATLEELGIADAAAGLNSPQTRGGDFRPVGGHQALVDVLAKGLDVRCDQPVASVHWNDDGVDVEARERVRAGAAVITLPLGVLQAGSVTFVPDLPEAKQSAVKALRMHPAIKIAVRFSRPVGSRRVRSVVGDDLVPAYWRSAADPPIWTAFVTGPRALSAAADPRRAVERLCSYLDVSHDAVAAVTTTDWGRDPWARGGYSSAPAGAFAQRAVLAEPIGCLVFAGEATSTTGEAGTVSGAILTGERAAAEAADILRR
jgi:monoamine oxidase